MVAAFLYITNGTRFDVIRPMRNAGRVWSEPPAASTAAYSPDEQNNIDVYKAARDATVNVTSTVYTRSFFGVFPEKGTGTGFIINPEGEILTNNHVIGGSSSNLTVTLSDKKVYKAKVLGYDPANDLALIKIDSGRKLPTLRLGDSDHLVVGQKVLAIGNPFQFEGTLTTGIVSSLGRKIQTQDSDLDGMIQTDAAINPGNSGGPLLDSHGNVLGINTAILGETNAGIGFAMPISRAKAMLEQYQASGKISRPWLGVNTMYVAGDLADMIRLPTSGGLLIQSIERGSAAESAGLRGPNQVVIVGNYRLGIGGDLIVAADGQPIDDKETLTRILTKKHGGDSLELTIYRNGRNERVTVKLGEAPQKF